MGDIHLTVYKSLTRHSPSFSTLCNRFWIVPFLSLSLLQKERNEIFLFAPSPSFLFHPLFLAVTLMFHSSSLVSSCYLMVIVGRTRLKSNWGCRLMNDALVWTAFLRGATSIIYNRLACCISSYFSESELVLSHPLFFSSGQIIHRRKREGGKKGGRHTMSSIITRFPPPFLSYWID